MEIPDDMENIFFGSLPIPSTDLVKSTDALLKILNEMSLNLMKASRALAERKETDDPETNKKRVVMFGMLSINTHELCDMLEKLTAMTGTHHMVAKLDEPSCVELKRMIHNHHCKAPEGECHWSPSEDDTEMEFILENIYTRKYNELEKMDEARETLSALKKEIDEHVRGTERNERNERGGEYE
jgi:hypothetical protein